MVELNDFQVQYIEAKLSEVKLRRHDLADELLDHLCCAVEEEIAGGQPFHLAVNNAFDTFQKDEMQDIQTQIISIHSKKRLMMKVSLFVLALLLVFSGFLWNREVEEPPLAAASTALTTVLFQKPPAISPLGSYFSITSGFGMRIHPKMKKKHLHRGVDFSAPEGTPILATANGKVEVAAFEKNYGNRIILRHDSIYQTLYAHLAELLVKEGDTVAQGDTIGKVGSTGLSKGPHLHYEVIKNGKPEDPENYMNISGH